MSVNSRLKTFYKQRTPDLAMRGKTLLTKTSL